jgi:leucyl-tRNA synthetase
MLNILYQRAVPVWIGDYVLAGTGAVMAVPCGDEEIMLLLTSLKDKRNAGNKIFF